MQENIFFKTVWRINALLFLFAGLGALALIAIGGFSFLREPAAVKEVHGITPGTGKNVDACWSLGGLMDIPGSPCSMVPLGTSGSGLKSPYFTTRNYVFVNGDTKDAHWLFPAMDALILNTEFFPIGRPGQERPAAEAIIYTVIEKDSNNDGELTKADMLTIAVSSPQGDDYTVLLRGIDKFIGQQSLDERTALFLYQKDGNGYYSQVDMLEPAVIANHQLPQVGR